MVFDFTAEQEELRRAVSAFLAATSPEPEIRRVMEEPAGYDPEVWRRMADELGLPGLVVPEEYGGSGAGMVELAVVLEEMGRGLYPGPFASTALAALAVLASGDEAAARDLLPGIAAGTTIATLAVAEASGRWSEVGISCAATPTSSGWQLSGFKHYVTDGHVADLYVVAARTDDGIALFAVSGEAAGLTREPVAGFDRTRRLATVGLDDVPARLLGPLERGSGLLARVLDLARVISAAEQAGGARAVLDMAVEYAKVRIQFGRVIGSFQAIKHMCADALLDVESARSAAYYAAWAAADGSDELPTVAPLAKAFCSDVFFETAAMNIQVHGGIAFTWEYPAHLYYRRAKLDTQLWGDAGSHRDLLATHIGL